MYFDAASNHNPYGLRYPKVHPNQMGTKIQYLKDDAALDEFRRKTSRSFDLGRMKG